MIIIFNLGTSAYYSGAISTSNGGIDTSSTSNGTVYHLTRSTDIQPQYNTSKMPERTHKAIPEIYLTRLLSTKGTIQKFVDDFFLTILAANERLPPAVKWLFDLFDDATKKYNITDVEVVHSWKSNRYFIKLPYHILLNFISKTTFMYLKSVVCILIILSRCIFIYANYFIMFLDLCRRKHVFKLFIEILSKN